MVPNQNNTFMVKNLFGKGIYCFIALLVLLLGSCAIQKDKPVLKYERLYILNSGKSVLINTQLGFLGNWGRYNIKIEAGKNQFDSVKRKDIYVERHPFEWHEEDVSNREIRRIAVFHHETNDFKAYSTNCSYNKATTKKFEQYLRTFKKAMEEVRQGDFINQFCTSPIN